MMQTGADKVWIIDDDKSIRWVLDKALKKAAIDSRCFSDAKTLLEALQNDVPDALLTDIRMPEMDGLALLERVHQRYPTLPIIVMTAHSDLESAVAAFHSGAFEYLPNPLILKK
jgi:two-component system, NtrC family, nitrogen regulation response regulator GlnG